MSPAGLEQTRITINADGKKHHFVVEVAETMEQQARGLMFRHELDANRGMLFPFDPPKVASFHMGNTMIPLDMIFIKTDGTIANIHRMTEPYSPGPYWSEGEIGAVLEIAGGRAAQLGIEPGDKVSWR